jgi:hypothetical protein
MKPGSVIKITGRAHGLDRAGARFTMVQGNLRGARVILCRLHGETGPEALQKLREGRLAGVICSVESDRRGILVVQARHVYVLGGACHG